MALGKLKKMSRPELVEIIYALETKMNEQSEELERLKQKLEDRTITINHAGSIAEAALKINDVMAAAQKAADQYLDSIKSQNADVETQAARIVKEAQTRADQIIADAEGTDAKERARIVLANAEKQASAMLGDADARAEETTKQAHAEAKEIVAQAESQAEMIIAQAQAMADEIMAQAKENADSVQEKLREHVEQRAELLRSSADDLLQFHENLTENINKSADETPDQAQNDGLSQHEEENSSKPLDIL